MRYSSALALVAFTFSAAALPAQQDYSGYYKPGGDLPKVPHPHRSKVRQVESSKHLEFDLPVLRRAAVPAQQDGPGYYKPGSDLPKVPHPPRSVSTEEPEAVDEGEINELDVSDPTKPKKEADPVKPKKEPSTSGTTKPKKESSTSGSSGVTKPKTSEHEKEKKKQGGGQLPQGFEGLRGAEGLKGLEGFKGFDSGKGLEGLKGLKGFELPKSFGKEFKLPAELKDKLPKAPTF